MKKQFEDLQKGGLIGGILLILLGMFAVLVTLLFGLTGSMPAVIGATYAAAGLGQVGIGIWAIWISRERSVDVSGAQIVVYESRVGLALGWLLYVVGVGLAVLVFSLACTEEMGCWIPAILMLAAFAGWTLCILDYRNRRILLNETAVWGVTAFGRAYRISRSEIGEIETSISIGGFVVKDREGRTLFRFESNMVHADELYLELCPEESEDGQAPFSQEAWRKKQELKWDPQMESWQTRHVKEIRRGFYRLLIGNLLLSVFLFLFCPSAILKQKYRLLLVELLPIAYLVYVWVFNDVMLWVGLSDTNASKEWKQKHASVEWGYLHMALVMLFVTDGVFSIQVNFIEGERYYWIGTVLLTALLWVITLLRTKSAPLKKLTLAVLLFPFLIISMGVMLAVTAATAYPAQQTHYAARVVELDEHHSRYSRRYYAETILADGSSVGIEVSRSTYRELEEGERKVVCENRAPFGIRFASIHDP